MTWRKRVEVLVEFDEAGESAWEGRVDLREAYHAQANDERRERDRVRKQIERLAAAIRRAEGYREMMCPAGCGNLVIYQVGSPGRPKRYCSEQCRLRMAARALRERIKAALGR